MVKAIHKSKCKCAPPPFLKEFWRSGGLRLFQRRGLRGWGLQWLGLPPLFSLQPQLPYILGRSILSSARGVYIEYLLCVKLFAKNHRLIGEQEKNAACKDFTHSHGRACTWIIRDLEGNSPQRWGIVNGSSSKGLNNSARERVGFRKSSFIKCQAFSGDSPGRANYLSVLRRNVSPLPLHPHSPSCGDGSGRKSMGAFLLTSAQQIIQNCFLGGTGGASWKRLHPN